MNEDKMEDAKKAYAEAAFNYLLFQKKQLDKSPTNNGMNIRNSYEIMQQKQDDLSIQLYNLGKYKDERTKIIKNIFYNTAIKTGIQEYFPNNKNYENVAGVMLLFTDKVL